MNALRVWKNIFKNKRKDERTTSMENIFKNKRKDERTTSMENKY